MRGFKFIFKKFFTIIAISLMVFSLISPISSNAAWYNNAVDFYNKYKNIKIAAYSTDTNSWLYGQRGVISAGSTLYYRTIGFRIEVKHGGKSYWCGVSRTDGVKDKGDIDTGGYRYSLWEVTFDTLMNRLKAENPNVDFSFMYDSSFDTEIFFDARVTFVRNGTVMGEVDSWGRPKSGTVWTSNSQAWNLTWSNGSVGYTVPQSEKDALFRIPAKISASSKPQPSVYTSSARFEGYEYKDPSQEVYWVQPDNQFRVVVEGYIPVRFNVYPTKMLANLQKTSNSRRSNIHLGADNTYGTGEYFYTYFKELTGQTTSKTSSASSKYLTSAIYLKALNHGDEFHLRYRAYYDNTASGTDFSNSDKYLKVDGVAPYLNSNYLNQATQINADVRYMSIHQQGVSDKASGVNVNGQYAYIYPKGSNHKGNKIPLVQHSVHKWDYVKDNFLL